jgi:hypothetical protein
MTVQPKVEIIQFWGYTFSVTVGSAMPSSLDRPTSLLIS